MNFDYIENELLEISSILKVLTCVDTDLIDILDIETLIALVSKKADELYCYTVDQLVKEMQKKAYI